MTSISGKTSNGFTFEGDYERGSSGRVTWTATYRRSGSFHGMRHGQLNGLSSVPLDDLDLAVKGDIESTWVEQR